MTIRGEMLIGQKAVIGTQANIQAVNPATGEKLEPVYVGGSRAHVEQACELVRALGDRAHLVYTTSACPEPYGTL